MVADKVLVWRDKTLEPARVKYVKRREEAQHRRNEIQRELAGLPDHLTDRNVRRELATKMMPVVADKSPLGDWVESLDSHREHHPLAVGIAMKYMPRIWESLRSDTRETGLMTKIRQAFLERVTMENLLSQEVFKEHILPRHKSNHDYELLCEVASLTNNKSRLRERHRHSEEAEELDPSLEWLMHKTEVDLRIEDLVSQARGLVNDYEARFKPKDMAAQRLQGDGLRALAEQIDTNMQTWTTKAAYDDMGFLRERHMILHLRRELEALRDGALLADLDAQTEDEFRRRLGEAQMLLSVDSSSVDTASIARRLTLTLKSEAARRFHEAVQSWYTDYSHGTRGLRAHSVATDNELRMVDRKWDDVRHNVENVGLPDMVMKALEADLEEQFHWAKDVSRVATMRSCVEALTGALRAPSTLASLTKSFSWREQVRRVARTLDVVVDSEARAWFETEEKAVYEAEQALLQVEVKWKETMSVLAASMTSLSKILDDQFVEWQTRGRVELGLDQYDRRLSYLKRHDPKDRIMWDSWERLLTRIAPADGLGAWWRPEESALFERNPSVLISWHDVQKCVLMLQWEALTTHHHVGQGVADRDSR